MDDLFGPIEPPDPPKESMAEGAVLLRGSALPFETEILAALSEITTVSPFRHMVTPGGFTMSVAMTNCGPAGWVTDRTGYRYDRIDPETGNPWPPMPGCFLELAAAAAGEAGYPEFRPDACLINRYKPGARLSLHQDKNERDFANPIVSVSLGLPATFLFGRPEAKRPGEEVRSQAWRCCRVGRSVAPPLSRRAGAEGWPSRDRRARAHQPDVPRCLLDAGPSRRGGRHRGRRRKASREGTRD
jgi:DNA oxidative demethylase